MLHLALASRHAKQNSGADKHPRLAPQLRQFAEQLAGILQAGRLTEARDIIRQLQLPPIAWGFLASCLQKHQVSDETIEGLLS